MKVLLFIPERYGFFHSYKEIFEYMGAEVHSIDFYHKVKSWEKNVNVQMFRLPNKFRLKWEGYYMGKINAYYREKFDALRPDVVFIYNNELLLPETLAYFKSKGTKIGFFLGDSPFYTQIVIISSYWTMQIRLRPPILSGFINLARWASRIYT